MDMRHRLDRETQNRHFPELHGGKGSAPRKSTKSSRELFADNYDKIFKKKVVENQ
jgi:stalled ribosome alternative rescue factor ArfA